ncbi:MAG TPA: hypothetical protein VHM26_12470 [Chitinophagaceae bacterium]|nr:hypothetical protein [Chitinophagaceae bacterium]
MRFLLLLAPLFVTACTTSSILKAKRTSILDEYFILGKKKYSLYVNAVARITSETGRYVISHDTVYLLHKRSGKNFTYRSYAIIDTSHSELIYHKVDTSYYKVFAIQYYKPRGQSGVDSH